MNDNLMPGSHIHLIAICGVGMASLAGLLQAQGYRVTGADQNVYPPMSTYLETIGIGVLSGYSAEHLSSRPDLVIVGNAVSKNNPEAQAVLDRGIPYISFPQALGRFLIGSRTSLVVTGTHGKTTTTALLAWALTCAGYDPGFFVGGVPINFGSGWSPGRGNYVVLEGDEYDSAFFDKGPKFLHYRPNKAILTSLEFDHADIYRDLEHLKAAFRRFIDLIPADGFLLVCSEHPAAKEVASEAHCPVSFYGDIEPSDWTTRNVVNRNGKTLFEPCYQGKTEGIVQIGLFGRHNVNNVLAAYAMGRELGIGHKELVQGLETFSGVKRRQEIKGEIDDILVIDDFAHHPTAVKETIDAIRSAYPGRRLWAIFEPRSNTSRRRLFAGEFARALAAADRVVIAGIYQPEKIPAEIRLSPAEVVDEINRGTGSERACYIEKALDIPWLISSEAQQGDIVLVMSNGGFDGVQDKILHALENSARAS
jgi:UDP-N-acetylmuramate: L-alanyl-gamma-D-glutamyl-meso-diaminopimelate ligase